LKCNWRSSSFAQYLEIQLEAACILPIALEISLFPNILVYGKYTIKLATGTIVEMKIAIILGK
jgi:hypothetical protein